MFFTTCAKLNVKIVLTYSYNVGRKAGDAPVCIKSASPGGRGDQVNNLKN